MLNAPSLSLTTATNEPLEPFEINAIELIIDVITPRTPRRINEVFSFYLDLAANDDSITTISENMIRARSNEIGLAF